MSVYRVVFVRDLFERREMDRLAWIGIYKFVTFELTAIKQVLKFCRYIRFIIVFERVIRYNLFRNTILLFHFSSINV